MVINKAAVVGAGLMGSGIARHMASHGVQVTLFDNSEEQLARAAQTNASMDLEYTSDMAAINAVDYVIEAVFEDLEVKRQVLGDISLVVSPDCLIASNTSSLLIGDLEKAVTDPNRFLGVHYNNPADMNPVVEIIPGDHTEQRRLSRTVGPDHAHNAAGRQPEIEVLDQHGVIELAAYADRLDDLPSETIANLQREFGGH